jgi:hypothetical protein
MEAAGLIIQNALGRRGRQGRDMAGGSHAYPRTSKNQSQAKATPDSVAGFAYHTHGSTVARVTTKLSTIV